MIASQGYSMGDLYRKKLTINTDIDNPDPSKTHDNIKEEQHDEYLPQSPIYDEVVEKYDESDEESDQVMLEKVDVND